MSVVRIDISEGIFINISNGYYKVLVINNCITNQNGLLYNTIEKYEIKHVVIRDEFHASIFDEIIEAMLVVFMYNNKFDSNDLYKLYKLKSLSIPDTYKMQIDFSNFKEMEDIDVSWNNNLVFKDVKNLKILMLTKYDKETFELELPNSIEYIHLMQGKLKSIQGIEKYQSLKALVLYAQSKIEDYKAIGELKSLEFLHIHGGQLKDITPFTKLKKLKWLVLENCKHIETLKPLMELDNLIGVQLVGTTKPLDGDKSIRDIKNKYEYNYPCKMIGQRLYKEF